MELEDIRAFEFGMEHNIDVVWNIMCSLEASTIIIGAYDGVDGSDLYRWIVGRCDDAEKWHRAKRAGMLYMMFIGKHLLPKVELDADQEIEQEIEANSTDSKKMIISGIILLAVVIVMALGIKGVTLEMAAIIGALVCVLTGCLTEKQAYASIDWVTIFLFAGMMPVSTAMDKTGAGKLIAEWTVSLMGGSPSPLVVTAVLFILSCGLTQFMSNTASAALLCPIGIAISKQLGADPKAVLMAIAVAASCAFATPVGTPPNTLVLGPGGYKFMDYVKAGTGLVLVAFVVSLVVIPMVWPFFPGK